MIEAVPGARRAPTARQPQVASPDSDQSKAT